MLKKEVASTIIYGHKLEEGVQAASTAYIPEGMSSHPVVHGIEKYLFGLCTPQELKAQESLVWQLLKEEELDRSNPSYLATKYGFNLSSVEIEHISNLLHGIEVKYTPKNLTADVSKIHDLISAVLVSHPLDSAALNFGDRAQIEDIMTNILKIIQKIIEKNPYSEHLPDALWTMPNVHEQGFEVIFARKIMNAIREMAEDSLYIEDVRGLQTDTLIKIGKIFQIYDPKKLETTVISIGRQLQDKINALQNIPKPTAKDIRPILRNVVGYLEALDRYQLLPDDRKSLLKTVSSLFDAAVKELRVPAIAEEQSLTSVRLAERPYFSVPEYADFLKRLKKIGMVDRKYFSERAKSIKLADIASYYRNSRFEDTGSTLLEIEKEFSFERFMLIFDTLESLGWLSSRDLLSSPGISDKTSEMLLPHLEKLLEIEQKNKEKLPSNEMMAFLQPIIMQEKEYLTLLNSINHPTLTGIELLAKKGLLGSTSSLGVVLNNLEKIAADRIQLSYTIPENGRDKIKNHKEAYSRIPYLNVYEKVSALIDSCSFYRQENEQQNPIVDKILTKLLDEMCRERNGYLDMDKVVRELEEVQGLQKIQHISQAQVGGLMTNIKNKYRKLIHANKDIITFEDTSNMVSSTDVLQALIPRRDFYKQQYETAKETLQDILHRWLYEGFRIIKIERLFENYVNNAIANDTSSHSALSIFGKRLENELILQMQKMLQHANKPEFYGMHDLHGLWNDVFKGLAKPPYTDEQIKSMGMYWKEYALPEKMVKQIFQKPENSREAFKILTEFGDIITDEQEKKIDAITKLMDKTKVVNTTAVVDQRHLGIQPKISNTMRRISFVADPLIDEPKKLTLKQYLLRTMNNPVKGSIQENIHRFMRKNNLEQALRDTLTKPTQIPFSMELKAHLSHLHKAFEEKKENKQMMLELGRVSSNKLLNQCIDTLTKEFSIIYRKEIRKSGVTIDDMRSFFEQALHEKMQSEKDESLLYAPNVLKVFTEKFKHHSSRLGLAVALWYFIKEGGQTLTLIPKKEKVILFKELLNYINKIPKKDILVEKKSPDRESQSISPIQSMHE